MGRILGVKGIGGYLLLCDTTNIETFIQLRARLRKSRKPFILMYPDTDMAYGDLDLKHF